MKHGFTTMTRKQSNNQVNGKISTLLGQKMQVTKSLGKNMFILFMDRKGMILTHAVPRGQQLMQITIVRYVKL